MKNIILSAVAILLAIGASTKAQDQKYANPSFIPSNIPLNPDYSDMTPIEYMEPRPDDVLWSKVVWRQIDLREKMNQALYYPEVPSDGRISLFSFIFKLLQENKINAYVYDENKEDFSPENKIPFPEILKNLDVYYQTKTNSAGDSIGYIVPDNAIPTREIFKYYIKEVWYFDKVESSLKVKILSICPQRYYEDANMGRIEKTALFWIPFEPLRKYLVKQPMVLNDFNNSQRITFDDYFMKRRFTSNIYKENNVNNRSIVEYTSNPNEAQVEQERIKNEIIDYEQSMWDY